VRQFNHKAGESPGRSFAWRVDLKADYSRQIRSRQIDRRQVIRRQVVRVPVAIRFISVLFDCLYVLKGLDRVVGTPVCLEIWPRH